MHPQTAALLVVSAVLPTLASVAVALRVLAKHMRKNRPPMLNASDHLVFVALVCLLVLKTWPTALIVSSS